MTLNRDRHCCEVTSLAGPVTLSVNSAVLISAFNSDRSYFCIYNDTVGMGIWVILAPSSGEAVKRGILVEGKSSWAMPTDNVYIGEIWAIADVDSPKVYKTEMS